jgi:cytoskeletal protein CcmA (bactofilin family)
MFKKVIGQDLGDTRPAPPATPGGYRAPEPLTPPPGSPVSPTIQQTPVSRPPTGGTRNILSSDVEIKGTVKFTNDLVVDGKIEGEISSDGSLTIGENARIKAEVKTATVVVYGKVQGNITATDRIELKASAEVIGDIKAKVLTIEAGAIFIGKSTVGTPAQAPAQAAAAPTQAAAKPAATAQAAPAKPASADETKQPVLPGAV